MRAIGDMRRARSSQGFTLIEVVIATGILGIICAGVIAVIYQTDRTDRILFQHTVATRAAHQAVEILLSEDMDSLLLQHGAKIAVFVNNSIEETGAVTMDGVNGADVDALVASGRYAIYEGTVSVVDLGWKGADKAYQVTVTVPAFGVTLSTVRSRT